MGMALSLQTENPLALEASNRRNVTSEEIDSAMTWAKGLNLNTYTDLIFGLPHETRDSFVEVLDKSIERGFDEIAIQNLKLMDGIEMNRPSFRKTYNIKTKYRILRANYAKYNGTFLAEHDEIAVSSNSFTYEDFLEVRYIGFMFHTVLMLDFQKLFIQFVRHLGIRPSKFFSQFCKPDRSGNWPEKYIRFLDDLRKEVEGELYDTKEVMVESAKKIYEANGNNVVESFLINTKFAGRLIYLEGNWIKKVFLRHLDDMMDQNLSSDDRNLASLLIDLGINERVDLKKIGKKKPLNITYDVIEWKKNKFKEHLYNLKMPEKLIKFSTNKSQTLMIEGFNKRFVSYSDQYYYLQAMEYIRPRKFLLHTLSYE